MQLREECIVYALHVGLLIGFQSQTDHSYLAGLTAASQPRSVRLTLLWLLMAFKRSSYVTSAASLLATIIIGVCEILSRELSRPARVK